MSGTQPAPRRRGPRSAQDRLRRLLVMLPWIMERGEVPVREVAERFELTEDEVVADLERVSMCGVPPYGPDDLVDLFVDDGIVFAGPPRFFDRPLSLTAPEAFALLTAARAAEQVPGADPEGALVRALAKLARVVDPDAVDIRLGAPPALGPVRSAADEGAELRIQYWSAASDEVSTRTVAPIAVQADRGLWYLRAEDDRSGEERTFRVDRIVAVERTGRAREVRGGRVSEIGDWFSDATDLPSAVLRLRPGAAWIAERLPVEEVAQLDDGTLRVRLVVSGTRWLEQLLLRAGADASVESPPELASLGRDAAARLLARYRATN
jgi:proteasome accessory factor C